LICNLKDCKPLTPGAVTAAISRYGDNSLRVPLPTFWQVYKEQLMGPVTVFQVFTVLLWLMDEYWKYALFSAMSLLMFEAGAYTRPLFSSSKHFQWTTHSHFSA